ncbi:hypothetical protein [Brevibacterium samyangense]|uniref:Uncharacterized protein n=1 Tax=Brevibacterium samyangense TaxID=366888 RepID=A0ABP5EN12_9MICO
MKISTVLAQAAEEGHHIVNELPVDPIWYGVVAFAILMLLMLVTMSWKGISYRHK